MSELPIMEQINKDYNTIRNLVLTESVTQKGQQYLHIHPHGSGHGSGNRAFGFTNKFLTYLVGYYISLEKKESLDEILLTKGNSNFINKKYIYI